jgi:uncharacterized protein (UPF0335 family)
MTENEPSEHDEVVSSLLDLQRRLRADGAGISEASAGASSSPVQVRTAEEPPIGSAPGRVTVSEQQLSVRMTPMTEPETAPVDDRVEALAQRLSRLEEDLSEVLDSIDSVQGDVKGEMAADIARRLASEREEADARVARLVAERMDAVSARLSAELGAQRRDLAGLLEQRIGDMEAGLRTAVTDALVADGDPEDPADPGDR